MTPERRKSALRGVPAAGLGCEGRTMVATKPHGTSVERFQSMSDGRVTVVGMWAWAALTAAVCVGLIVLVTGSPWWLVLAPVLVALFYWEIRDIRG
jgi:hypothetical protein